MIVVGVSPGKGRGIFASRKIQAGDLIEEAPVIVLPGAEIEQHLERTVLQRLLLSVGRRRGGRRDPAGPLLAVQPFVLQPNTVFVPRPETCTIRFVALRDIEAGEEITTNYNGNPDSLKPVWFDAQP